MSEIGKKPWEPLRPPKPAPVQPMKTFVMKRTGTRPHCVTTLDFGSFSSSQHFDPDFFFSAHQKPGIPGIPPEDLHLCLTRNLTWVFITDTNHQIGESLL